MTLRGCLSPGSMLTALAPLCAAIPPVSRRTALHSGKGEGPMNFHKFHIPHTLKSMLTLLSLAAILLAACAPIQPTTQSDAASAEGEGPIYIGVSGPLTGPTARYGEQWIKGFDLALEEINGAGGINGRPLEYIFEDTQSDPKQSVVVAQKFVADPRIIVEL